MVVFGGVKQVSNTEDLETLGDLFVLTGLEFLRRSKGRDVNCANVNLEAKDRLVYEFDPDVVSKKMRWHKVEITGDQPGARECHSCCQINGKLYFFGGEGR